MDDRDLRLEALRLAVDSRAVKENYEDALSVARQFYNFLMGDFVYGEVPLKRAAA